MKKSLMSVLLGTLVLVQSFGVDLTFRMSPEGLFFNSNEFSYGLAGIAQLDMDLLGCLTVGTEGIGIMAQSSTDNWGYSMFYGGGVGIGAYYYPLSRLYLGAGVAGGIYQADVNYINKSNEKESYTSSDFYYRAYGELGFRVNPNVTVSATGGYMNMLLHGSDPFATGFFGGLNIRYTATLGKQGSNDFGVSFDQYGNAFPLYMRAYRNCPLGLLTLRNNTGAEVKNVHVSLRAGKYTSSGFESQVISKINKYGTADIMLLADFNEEILKFSENGKISAQIIVDYEFLGKKMQTVQNISLGVYNRNAFVWADPTGLCAFVDPETPEVMELAKYLAGVARTNFISGMNRSVQISAAMLEGLLLSGISYSPDEETPYEEYHSSYMVDSIQYPLQTMNFLGGDYDDLGILLMSCLESVGIDCAFMPLDDDFVVLVDTGIKPGQELNYFGSDEGLLVDSETVYFPLSMVKFNNGFAASRKEGVEKMKKVYAGDYENVEYINVRAGWQVYSPCAFTGNGTKFTNPVASALTTKINAAVKDYIDTDMAQVVARARGTGDSNKIGIALYRSGKYTEAKREFQKLNTTAAKNNLANVYIVEKNYTEAARLYRSVLATDPNNRIAQKGLETANAKLGN